MANINRIRLISQPLLLYTNPPPFILNVTQEHSIQSSSYVLRHSTAVVVHSWKERKKKKGRSVCARVGKCPRKKAIVPNIGILFSFSIARPSARRATPCAFKNLNTATFFFSVLLTFKCTFFVFPDNDIAEIQSKASNIILPKIVCLKLKVLIMLWRSTRVAMNVRRVCTLTDVITNNQIFSHSYKYVWSELCRCGSKTLQSICILHKAIDTWKRVEWPRLSHLTMRLFSNAWKTVGKPTRRTKCHSSRIFPLWSIVIRI